MGSEAYDGIPIPRRYPSLSKDDDLIVDDIPPLSREEMIRLNPVIVSSRQKVACAYEKCDNMIYPPKKLCDACTTILHKGAAEKIRKDRENEHK